MEEGGRTGPSSSRWRRPPLPRAQKERHRDGRGGRASVATRRRPHLEADFSPANVCFNQTDIYWCSTIRLAPLIAGLLLTGICSIYYMLRSNKWIYLAIFSTDLLPPSGVGCKVYLPYEDTNVSEESIISLHQVMTFSVFLLGIFTGVLRSTTRIMCGNEEDIGHLQL